MTLRLDGDAIVHRGPRSVLSPDVLAKLRQHKAEAIAELRRRVDAGPPCPADSAALAAIVSVNDRCDPVTAGTGALTEHGTPSWRARADSHRERILGELARLPHARNDHGRRLLSVTRRFLDTDHWHIRSRLGGSRSSSLASTHMRQRIASSPRDLLPGWRWRTRRGADWKPSPRNMPRSEIDLALLFIYRRGDHGFDVEELWWRCPALIGGADDLAEAYSC